jgi:Condensation domain
LSGSDFIVLPLSTTQREIWFSDQHDHGPDFYNTQQILGVDGDLDAAALHTAGQVLVNRYPNLRAAFRRTTEGRYVTLIPRQVRLPWQAVICPIWTRPPGRLKRPAFSPTSVPAGSTFTRDFASSTRPQHR